MIPDGGNDPTKQLELVPGAMDDAIAFLEDKKDPSERFNRVADLVVGFETPLGLGLPSTAHWIPARKTVHLFRDSFPRFYSWGDHKKRLISRQFKNAHIALEIRGWSAPQVNLTPGP